MTIQDRVQAFVAYLGMSSRQVELKAGISNGSLSTISESSYQRTFDKISRAFPTLNIDWLRHGIGEMIISDEDCENSTSDTPYIYNKEKEDAISAMSKAIDEISAQRKVTEKAQEQIDRLLGIVEKMSN